MRSGKRTLDVWYIFFDSSSSASNRTLRGVAPRADLLPSTPILLPARFDIGVEIICCRSSSSSCSSRAIAALRIQGAGTCGPNAPAALGFTNTAARNGLYETLCLWRGSRPVSGLHRPSNSSSLRKTE